MTAELSKLIAEEAKALSTPAPIDYAKQRDQIEKNYRQSFDPLKDKDGNVIWYLLIGNAQPKPIQKWFKALPSMAAAIEKAHALREKLGASGLSFSLVLEGRDDVLAKLGGAR